MADKPMTPMSRQSVEVLSRGFRGDFTRWNSLLQERKDQHIDPVCAENRRGAGFPVPVIHKDQRAHYSKGKHGFNQNDSFC